MKLVTLAVVALIATACVGSLSQKLLTACEAHDAAVQALAPQVAASMLSQRQVDAVDVSIGIADTICDGTAAQFGTALVTLKGELTRLAIMRNQ